MTKFPLDSRQVSRVCLIHISQFGTSHETHSVTDMYIKITKQAREHSRAISMAWFTWKVLIEDGQERKIHCILIASLHVCPVFLYFANHFLRMNNISSCVEDCSAALELQPSYSKALHRWRKAISHAVIWKSHRWKFWMWRHANHIGGDMK